MMSAPAVSRIDCSGEISAFPGMSVCKIKKKSARSGVPTEPSFSKSNLICWRSTGVFVFIILLRCNYLFLGTLSFVYDSPSIHSYGKRTVHSSAVLIESSSLNCDNSICSASLAMNYGWTLQPLNYGDWAALGFLRAPAGVVDAAWIYRKKKRRKIKLVFKETGPVSRSLFPRRQRTDWLLCLQSY